MLRLIESNRAELLLDALALDLDGLRRHPLDPVSIVVPNRLLESALSFGLAERRGIAANLRFGRLEALFDEVGAAARPPRVPYNRRRIYAGLLAVLLRDPLEGDDLAPVRHYLGPLDEGRPARTHQLAQRLAARFEEYALRRPELLLGFAAGAPGDGVDPDTHRWQAALFRRAFPPGRAHRGLPLAWPSELLTELGALDLGGPARAVFGFSHVAPIFHQLLVGLARTTDVAVYALNPCREFWEDLRLRPLDETGDEPRLLGLFGRPGREHVRALHEATGFASDERFSPTARGTLLSAVQDDILERRAPSPAALDGSLRVVAAPSLRREAEALSDLVWSLLLDGRDAEPPLTARDVVVWVNPAERDRYLPELSAAFARNHRRPHAVLDLPAGAGSGLYDLATALLELPFSRASRSELLAVLTHPSFAGVPPEGGEAWVELADRLGIVFGKDRGELSGSYVERDLLTWDQGIHRLILGALVAPPAEDPVPVELAGERYLPLGTTSGRLAATLRFARSARALIDDVRDLESRDRPLAEWSERLARFLETHLGAESDADERDRTAIVSAARRLGEAFGAAEPGAPGVPVPARIALALLTEALGDLTRTRGTALMDGVTLGALHPMRALPFRVVVLAGFGEASFPAEDRRDPLDLRGDRRRAGDVTPGERDRYMFLEALLSCRETLIVSYVARDEQTAEERAPSVVVRDLLETLEAYVGDVSPLVVRPPLRAHDGPSADEGGLRSHLPGVHLERHARRVGQLVRRRAGGDLPDPAALLARLEPPAVAARLRGWLDLPELPARGGPGLELVPLRALTWFLRCPLQGAAAALGGARGEADDPFVRDDEPFSSRLSERDASALLAESIASGRPIGEVHAEWFLRAELAGRAPTGVLGRAAQDRERGLLEAWMERLAPAPGSAVRVAFGGQEVVRGARRERAVELPGRGERLAGVTHLALGAAGPLVRLLPIPLWPSSSHDGPYATRVRTEALGAYLDHLVLTFTGLAPPGDREVVLLFGRTAADAGRETVTLRAIDREAAGRVLAGLVSLLVDEPSDYLLPCEAVFSWWARREPPEALVEAVHRAMEASHPRASSRGPYVRRPERALPPRPPRAVELADRRLGDFLRRLEWSPR